MNPKTDAGPDALPPVELSVGTHLTPDDGACLMEWVSALAGEPWSDAPASTHPVLAHLARLVNDSLSSDARPQLLPLAPRLVDCNSPDLTLPAELAELVTGYAARIKPGPSMVWMRATAHRHHQLAGRTPDPGQLSRAIVAIRMTAYRRGPALRAVEAAVRAISDTTNADNQLLECLDRAISLVESRIAPTRDVDQRTTVDTCRHTIGLGRSASTHRVGNQRR